MPQPIDWLERIGLRRDGRLLDQDHLPRLGQQQSLRPPPSTGVIPLPNTVPPANNSFSSIVLLQTEAKNHANPEVYTVTIAQPIIGGSTLAAFEGGAGIVIELRARIEWGSGGAGLNHVADVDLLQGQQITVLGTFVRVTAMYALNFLGVGVVAPPITVAASLGWGPRASSAHSPAWSVPLFVAAGSPAIQRIPPYARDVTVWLSPPSPPPAPFALYQVAFLDTSGTVVASWIQTTPGAPPTVEVFPPTIPIPHAQTVQIEQLAGGGGPVDNQAYLRFGLDL
jgi:hypothetical protein